MRREDIDPVLRSLAGPKYRPALIAAAIAAPVLTLLVSSCLCCGLSGWMFPSSAPSNDKAEEGSITVEEFDALVEQVTRKRDLEAVTQILRSHKELPQLDPSQLQFDEVGVIENPMAVTQVLDEKNALVRIGGRRSILLVWVTGAPTDRWVDDEPLHLEGAFIVAGKRKYQTVTGASKTVYLLRWIEPATLQKAKAALPAA